jgi:hypothetical protein
MVAGVAVSLAGLEGKTPRLKKKQQRGARLLDYNPSKQSLSRPNV